MLGDMSGRKCFKGLGKILLEGEGMGLEVRKGL